MLQPMSRLLLVVSLMVPVAGCYDPTGPIPEAKKPPVAPLWSDADVDAVVQVTYEAVPARFVVTHPDLPAGCNDVRFLRFKARDAVDDAAQADAAMLLLPGVLEGANGFEYLGRQLVYMAKTQRNKNIEIWAMDRRSNCLEDLRGFQHAELAQTVEEAEDLVLGYYYEGLALDGETFAGFRRSRDMPYLLDFGMQQTTEDMYAVIQAMVPDPAISRKKVFVGGHSMGGIHTSMFLSWDLDGDASTLDDAGANLVAGAIGFDTTIGPLVAVDRLLTTYASVATPLLENQAIDNDGAYGTLLSLLRKGVLPKNVHIPGLFSAEAIALPEAVGLFAALAPDQESRVLQRLPQSPEVKALFRFFHTRDGYNFVYGPHIESFRYTNAANVGLMFDDDFSILAFLQTSLGHLHGGAVVKKSPLVSFARKLPLIGTLIANISGPDQQFIAADAGPRRSRLGEGPLYSWTPADQIGDADDPDYTDITGTFKYTDMQDEMVRMEDFTRALYVGETNLTEWYMPMRAIIDILAGGKSFAPKYGINTLHLDAPLRVPTIMFMAGNGIRFPVPEVPGRPYREIVIPGASHLDPLFATVNTPQVHTNLVADTLLDFVLGIAMQE